MSQLTPLRFVVRSKSALFGAIAVGGFLLMSASPGCVKPGGGGTAGTTGSGGMTGQGQAGNSGQGQGGTNAQGMGGAANEVVITGQAGTVGQAGTTGAGVAGTTGQGAGTTGQGAGTTGQGAGTTGQGGRGGTTGAAGTGAPKMSCTAGPSGYPYSPGYPADGAWATTAQNAVNSMTTGDRATQLRGMPHNNRMNWDNIFSSPDVPNVKGWKFRDGPRGVNLLPSNQAQGYSTTFPVPMARGATFNLALEYAIGQAMGDEMVAAGQTNLLSPTTNILRHPLWGRSQETYGEDAFQLGRLGTANVVGIQEYVPACAKHYAANNIENNRAGLNAMMDEQTLHEVYARHFQMMIQDGGVSCIMAAYNAINGTKSTQNNHLLNEMLRGEFGFKGFVLTDWWAMPGGSGIISTDQQKGYATAAINAGLDMELPWNYNYSQLEAQVTAGQVTQATINAAALRVVREKFRFNVAVGTGLKAATTTYNASQNSINNNDAHIAIARNTAREAMVLLKNSGSPPALPIKQAGRTVNSIAVIGKRVSWTITGSGTTLSGMVDFARDIRIGDLGSSRTLSDPAKTVGPLAGIMAAAGGTTVTPSDVPTAASTADFVVVVVGLTQQDEGEEYTGASDRTAFGLDAKTNQGQVTLIQQVAAMGKPMVVVIESGAVVDTSWFSMLPATSAVVQAWYPGQGGGTALGQLLFATPLDASGNPATGGTPANFSGKLPITWRTDGWPTFNEGNTTVMNFHLGYRRFDMMNATYNPANGQFPFGYGLSYAKFRYENLVVPCSDVTKTGVVNVQVDVINTGTVAGAESVLLFVDYAQATVAGAMKSVKELKGFHKTGMIAPGMGARVTIPLRVSDLVYYDTAARRMQPVTGRVNVMVGHSGQPAVANISHDNTTFLTDSFIVN